MVAIDPIHKLRKTREHIWKWEEKLPLLEFCDLAGHSPAVYVKYYRTQKE